MTPIPACIVDERVHRWPGSIDRVRYDPQRHHHAAQTAPVVVVHVDHLMEILIKLATWAGAWYSAFDSDALDPALIAAWPLETAIWQALGDTV